MHALHKHTNQERFSVPFLVSKWGYESGSVSNCGIVFVTMPLFLLF